MPKHLQTWSIRLCLFWLMLCCGPAAGENVSYPPIQVGGVAGGLNDASVTDAEIGFKLIFNELLAKGDEHVNIKIYDSHDQMLQDFEDGAIQAVFISSLTFLDLNHLIHPTGRYALQFGPRLKQRYLVLVRREDRESRLASFRGKKLVMAQGHMVGKQFLDVTLLKQGLAESDDFFSEILTVEEMNSTIIDLFFGKVDVALVPEFSFDLARELNPQIGSEISVLATSPPLVYELVGLRYDFPQQRLDKTEPYILDKNHSPRVKHLLQTFRITALHRVDEDILKEVRELRESYISLTGQPP